METAAFRKGNKTRPHLSLPIDGTSPWTPPPTSFPTRVTQRAVPRRQPATNHQRGTPVFLNIRDSTSVKGLRGPSRPSDGLATSGQDRRPDFIPVVIFIRLKIAKTEEQSNPKLTLTLQQPDRQELFQRRGSRLERLSHERVHTSAGGQGCWGPRSVVFPPNPASRSHLGAGEAASWA